MDNVIAEIECVHCGHVFSFGDSEILPAIIKCGCGMDLDCGPALKEFYPIENSVQLE